MGVFFIVCVLAYVFMSFSGNGEDVGCGCLMLIGIAILTVLAFSGIGFWL